MYLKSRRTAKGNTKEEAAFAKALEEVSEYALAKAALRLILDSPEAKLATRQLKEV